MSAIRTSLIGTLSGWIVAFGCWVTFDVFHPQPPEDTSDLLIVDVCFVVYGSPVALALGLVLWGFCAWLGRTPQLLQAPLWSLSGGALGSGLLFLAVLPPWRSSFPSGFLTLSSVLFSWGSLAGFVAFTIAFVLCYRAQMVMPKSVPTA